MVFCSTAAAAVETKSCGRLLVGTLQQLLQVPSWASWGGAGRQQLAAEGGCSTTGLPAPSAGAGAGQAPPSHAPPYLHVERLRSSLLLLLLLHLDALLLPSCSTCSQRPPSLALGLQQRPIASNAVPPAPPPSTPAAVGRPLPRTAPREEHKGQLATRR